MCVKRVIADRLQECLLWARARTRYPASLVVWSTPKLRNVAFHSGKLAAAIIVFILRLSEIQYHRNHTWRTLVAHCACNKMCDRECSRECKIICAVKIYQWKEQPTNSHDKACEKFLISVWQSDNKWAMHSTDFIPRVHFCCVCVRTLSLCAGPSVRQRVRLARTHRAKTSVVAEKRRQPRSPLFLRAVSH